MPSPPACWRSPEELLELTIARSRLVLINEAHHGMLQCIRTREIGVRLVTAAHKLGIRHLPMEAVPLLAAEIANRTRQLPADAAGYLGQADMHELIECALDHGWRLIAYEADMSQKPPEFASLSNDETNGRDVSKPKPRASFRRIDHKPQR